MDPLSMIEAMDYLKESKTENPELIGFVKKFRSKALNGREMRKKLQELNLMKIKEEHISKIIELMPENKEDLIKIFTDVSLDENESQKILEIIKKYK